MSELVSVRPLTTDDRPAWDRLWAAYLEFYGKELPATTSEHAFVRLVGRRDGMAGFVATDAKGEVVGVTHVIEHPSTWADTSVLYLEDLFVDPGVRGRGVGRALIEAVYAEAEARGSIETYWITREDNATARRLYDDVAELLPYVRYERETPPRS